MRPWELFSNTLGAELQQSTILDPLLRNRLAAGKALGEILDDLIHLFRKDLRSPADHIIHRALPLLVGLPRGHHLLQIVTGAAAELDDHLLAFRIRQHFFIILLRPREGDRKDQSDKKTAQKPHTLHEKSPPRVFDPDLNPKSAIQRLK